MGLVFLGLTLYFLAKKSHFHLNLHVKHFEIFHLKRQTFWLRFRSGFIYSPAFL